MIKKLGSCLGICREIGSRLGFRRKVLPEEIGVPVKVVCDEKYRGTHPYWEEEARNLVEEASKLFRIEFGIRFEVKEVIPWQSPDFGPILQSQYAQIGTWWLSYSVAKEISFEGLVVVLLGGDLPSRYSGMEWATEKRGFKEYYVLIWADSENPRNNLLHEFGHVFNAKHPCEEWGQRYCKKHPSVMDPAQVETVDTFDPKNRRLILKNRDKFQQRRRPE